MAGRDGESEVLGNATFGQLEWDARMSRWMTTCRLPTGASLEVHITPYQTDRHAFVAIAEEMFRWAIDHERAMLSTAIRSYLLDLYNEGWKQEDEPLLTEPRFSAHLEWRLLKLTANSSVPIEYVYDPGELYEALGGHLISVRLDKERQFKAARLA